jgi:hypothetical protein
MYTGTVLVVALVGAIIAALRADWAWITRPLHAKRLERERAGDRQADFVRTLDGQGVGADVAHATYYAMQAVVRLAGSRRFPVRADDLLATYGLTLTDPDDADNPDLRFTVWQIAVAAGRQLPVDWRVLDSELRGLRTVADVASWVAVLPANAPTQ